MKLIFTFLIVSIVFFSKSQTYPVQALVNLVPPHSTDFNNFKDPSSNKLQIILTLTDFSVPSYDIKLRIKISDALGNYEIRTKQSLANLPSFTLSSGSPLYLSGNDLAPYFNAQNLISTNFNLLGDNQLPEGFTNFCIEVVNANPALTESLTDEVCSITNISLLTPPVLASPMCDYELTNPDDILTFSWFTNSTIYTSGSAIPEYVFEIYPVFDEGQAIDAIVAGAQYDSVITNISTLQFGFKTNYGVNSISASYEGAKEYIWRVRERFANFNGAYQNGTNGYSEWCRIKRTNPAQDLVNTINLVLEASGTGKRQGSASWSNNSDLESYHLEYRKLGYDEWFTTTSYTPTSKINNLEPETEYECRVYGSFSGYNTDYSNTVNFITKPTIEYECGNKTLPATSPDVVPYEQLEPGNFVEIGQFDMEITQAQHLGNGRYKGTGKIRVPFILITLRTEFDNILVDQNLTVREGNVRTITEGMEDWIQGQYAQFVEPIWVEGPIDDVYMDADSNMFITFNGQTTPVNFGPEGYPVIYNDEYGNQVTIYPNGVVNYGTYLELSNDQLDATADNHIQFLEDDTQTFGFDKKEHIQWHENYEIIQYADSSGNYWVANKSVGKNETDVVGFEIVSSEASNSPITFITDNGENIEFTDGVVNLPSKSSDYSLYAIQDEQRIGKLNVYVYKEKLRELVLVPLTNTTIDAAAVETELNQIYAGANTVFTVTVADTFSQSLAYDTVTFAVPDVVLLSKYSEEMKALRAEFLEVNPETSNKANIIFLINDFRTPNIDGYMVRGRGVGFVKASETNIEKVIAHELGHGVGGLAHTWKNGGPDEGSTSNLLDYNGGTTLIKEQWDEIHKAKLIPSYWDEEEDLLFSFNSVLSFWNDEKIWRSVPSGSISFLTLNGRIADFGSESGETISDVIFDKYGRLAYFRTSSDIYQPFIVRSTPQDGMGYWKLIGYVPLSKKNEYKNLPNYGTSEFTLEDKNFIEGIRYSDLVNNNDGLITTYTCLYEIFEGDLGYTDFDCFGRLSFYNYLSSEVVTYNELVSGKISSIRLPQFADSTLFYEWDIIEDNGCNAINSVTDVNEGFGREVYLKAYESAIEKFKVEELKTFCNFLSDKYHNDSLFKYSFFYHKEPLHALNQGLSSDFFADVLIKEELFSKNDFDNFFNIYSFSREFDTIFCSSELRIKNQAGGILDDNYNYQTVDWKYYPNLSSLHSKLNTDDNYGYDDYFDEIFNYLQVNRVETYQYDKLDLIYRYSYLIGGGPMATSIIISEDSQVAQPIHPTNYSVQYLLEFNTDVAFWSGAPFLAEVAGLTEASAGIGMGNSLSSNSYKSKLGSMFNRKQRRYQNSTDGNLANGGIVRIGNNVFNTVETPLVNIRKLHGAPKKSKPANFIDDLASDIQTNGYNLSVGPPIEGVRMSDGQILIFDGHHRLKALEQLGESNIPLRIKDYSEIPDEGMRLMLKIGEESGFYLPHQYPTGYSIPNLGPSGNFDIDLQATKFLEDNF